MSHYSSGAMVRGGRSYSSPRGSYRGSNRGSSWNGGGGGYMRNSRDRFSSFDSSYDEGSKYDRYSRVDDFPKPYRTDTYSFRDRHSPERKRPRTEGPSSRHDSYEGRYDHPYHSERRGYSGDRERHFSSSSPYSSRREDFSWPPSSPRGSTIGRLRSRGSRGLRRRGGGSPRRRMVDRSYLIVKRGMIRSSKYARRSKLMRLKRRVDSSENESSGDDKEKTKEPKEKAEKTDGEEDKEVKEGEEKEEDEKMEVTEEGGEQKEKPKEKKEKKDNDEKLVCPQCNFKVTTFSQYEAHLQGKTHLFAMRKTAAKQRTILVQMRRAQRNHQNKLEQLVENITEPTAFCQLCELNYQQEKAVHQNSYAHKKMRKFLTPLCKVCKITFQSPMMYQNHLCSIDHLKKKQRVASTSDAEKDNLDESTTIDSSGELDENVDSKEAEKEETKKEVSVGIGHIKKIVSYYCDLCRMYLPRATDNELADLLASHCRHRFHMQRYIRHKENEELKKRNEKLQRRKAAEREKKKDKPKKEDGETSVENVEMKEESKGDLEPKEGDVSKVADDDKLWEAVDKDLGELLEEGNKSDDDDEDSRVNGERFDRFKSAEKEKNGEEAEDGEEGEKPEETSDKVVKEEETK